MDLPPVAGTPPPAQGTAPPGGGTGLTLLEQISGVVSFHAPIYRAIARDNEATLPAMIIVVVVSLFAGVMGIFSSFTTLWAITAAIGSAIPAVDAAVQQAGGPTALLGDPSGMLVSVASAPVGALLGWVIWSWLYSFIAKFYGGVTTLGAMLRINGFVALFSAIGAVVGIIPCGGIVGFVLGIAATIVGVREAAFADRPDGLTKSILTVISAVAVVALIVTLIIGCMLAFFAAIIDATLRTFGG